MIRLVGSAVFLAVVAAAQPADEKLAAATVEVVNFHEIELYKNPSDGRRLTMFKQHVISGSPKEKDVVGRVERARGRKDRVKPDSEHKVLIRSVQIKGDTALVETVETSYWEWESGKFPPFQQDGKIHTYFLEKNEGRWKIKEDQF